MNEIEKLEKIIRDLKRVEKELSYEIKAAEDRAFGNLIGGLIFLAVLAYSIWMILKGQQT